MKKLFPILLFFTFLNAQTKETIVSSGNYYYGEAVAEQEQEASDHALKNLVQSISVKVTSEMTRVVSEKNGNVQDVTQNVINSYADATLREVKWIKHLTGNGIEAFCYMEKSEVTKMFAERKKLVQNMFETAMQCEEVSNIADALKYYYFAIILMNSIPEKTIEYQSKNLLTEIPFRINTIIHNTKFTLVGDKAISEKERELQFEVKTNGKPIRMIDFSCWDGSSQVHVRAVDGVGIFRLYGAGVSFDKIDASIKYQYYESREELKEVFDLWNSVVKPQFKNSQTLSLQAVMQKFPSQIAESNSTKAEGSKFSFELTNKENCPKLKEVQSGTLQFLVVLDKNNLDAIKKLYASDPFIINKLAGLMKYNNPIPVDKVIKADVNKTATGWEVRKIRVLTSYPTLKKQSIEYLILDFDNNGNLYDVNCGTVENLYNEFVEQSTYGNDWENRLVIIKFVEKYRTAFLTRNMPMLDSLFADEAVIIVGRELKKGKKKDEYQYAKLNESQPDIQYTQYTKKQYLDNQKKVFQNQKDIFLSFSTFKITKKNQMPGTYGISMKQNYAASTYADEGHLFLLVDFLQEQPQIYVRSWQPHEWNDDAMIKLANFRLNK